LKPEFKEKAEGFQVHFDSEHNRGRQRADAGVLQLPEFQFSYVVSNKWVEELRKYIGYPEILKNEDEAITSNVPPQCLLSIFLNQI
jgi:hypothetical protein